MSTCFVDMNILSNVIYNMIIIRQLFSIYLTQKTYFATIFFFFQLQQKLIRKGFFFFSFSFFFFFFGFFVELRSETTGIRIRFFFFLMGNQDKFYNKENKDHDMMSFLTPTNKGRFFYQKTREGNHTKDRWHTGIHRTNLDTWHTGNHRINLIGVLIKCSSFSFFLYENKVLKLTQRLGQKS